jgi:hypothetical protein
MKKNKLNLSLDYKVTSHLQAHLQFAQANARPKIAKELVSLQPKQNYFLKFPSLLKFFKTATAQPTQTTAKAATFAKPENVMTKFKIDSN